MNASATSLGAMSLILRGAPPYGETTTMPAGWLGFGVEDKTA